MSTARRSLRSRVSRNGRQHVGLATRLLDSSIRNHVLRMFAVQPLASLLGIAVSLITGLRSNPVLDTWNATEPKREG